MMVDLDAVLRIFTRWKAVLPSDRGFNHAEGVDFVRRLNALAAPAPTGAPRCVVCAYTALPCMGGHAGRLIEVADDIPTVVRELQGDAGRAEKAMEDAGVSSTGTDARQSEVAPTVAPADLVSKVLALQAHAREHNWQDVDEPIAALLEWVPPVGSHACGSGGTSPEDAQRQQGAARDSTSRIPGIVTVLEAQEMAKQAKARDGGGR